MYFNRSPIKYRIKNRIHYEHSYLILQYYISYNLYIQECEDLQYLNPNRLLTKSMTLEEVEKLVANDLNEQSKENQIQIQEIQRIITSEIERKRKFIQSLDGPDKDENNMTVDAFTLTKVERDFLNYLENRHIGQSRQVKQGRLDDLLCQVCNDGDYLEDNLIVICSKCSISVHQKCYGIDILPQDDWICDLCTDFGIQGANMRCPLCTSRGGAMKQTNTALDSLLFENLNPTFHSYTQSTNQSITNPVQSLDNTMEPKENQDDIKNQQVGDFLQLQDNNESKSTIELIPKYVWIHLSCAYWIPECFFMQNGSNKQQLITGLQQIDKKRFNLLCNICKQKNVFILEQGACVQCAKGKCCIAFHPECARRAQLYMDPRPYPQSYLIYCDKHMPVTLKRILQNKAKEFIDELQGINKTLEKLQYTHLGHEKQRYNKLTQPSYRKPHQSTGFSSEKKRKSTLRAQRQELEAQIEYENQQLIQALVQYLEKTLVNKTVINLQVADTGYTVSNVNTPNSLASNKSISSIKKDDKIWEEFTYQDYNPAQIYKLYRRALRMDKKKRKNKHKSLDDIFDEEYENRRQSKHTPKLQNKKIRKLKLKSKLKIKTVIRQIHTFRSNRLKLKKRSNIKVLLNDPKATRIYNHSDDQNKMLQDALTAPKLFQQPVQDDQLYCICKQTFKEGETMMQCELCSDWYHLKCLGFTQGIDQAQSIKFYCFLCEQKVERELLKRTKLVYKHYFTDPTFKALKNKILRPQKVPKVQKLPIQKMVKQTKVKKETKGIQPGPITDQAMELKECKQPNVPNYVNGHDPSNQLIEKDSIQLKSHFTRNNGSHNYKSLTPIKKFVVKENKNIKVPNILKETRVKQEATPVLQLKVGQQENLITISYPTRQKDKLTKISLNKQTILKANQNEERRDQTSRRAQKIKSYN